MSLQDILDKTIKAWRAPACCEVHQPEGCKQWRECPIRCGTHKPAQALHQIEEPKK